MPAGERGIACGWAGQPEEAGIFLTHPGIADARFFAGMGGGRRIDIWRVDVTGLTLEDLTLTGGWWLCREVIGPERIELVEVWDTGGGLGELRPVPLPRPPKSRARRRRR
jgi:hypothetical protein